MSHHLKAAFDINKALGIKLSRNVDLIVEVNKKKFINFPLYSYENIETRESWTFIVNKIVVCNDNNTILNLKNYTNFFVAPELKEANGLLFLTNAFCPLSEIKKKLSLVYNFQWVFFFNFHSLKNQKNLSYLMEYDN